MSHCILCSITGIGRCCMIGSMPGWTPCWPPDWWRKHGRPTPLAVPRHGRPLGTKELLPYLEGSEPLETAVERLKQETRRYAKRQITWFKRRQGTVVLEPDTMDTERLIAAATAQAEDFLYGKDKGKRA